MKKHLFIVNIMLLFTTSISFAQNMVRVYGDVKGDTKGYNKIYVYGKGISPTFSTIKEGKFSFEFPFNGEMSPTFYTEYGQNNNMAFRPLVAVIDQPGDLFLKGMAIDDEIKLAKWSGIQSAEVYQRFDNLVSNELLNSYKRLSEELGSENHPDYNNRAKNLRKSIVAPLLENFVAEHHNSFVSAFVLLTIGKGVLSIDDLDVMYDSLAKDVKGTKPAEELRKHLTSLKSASLGSRVKNFVLDTPKGDSVTFSKLKGKYVVIDFWASWCVPCINSFPHMKSIYEKYKGDQFEIYGISIDSDRKEWLKSCDRLNLPWLLSLDTKNISKEQFAVTSVPTTFLISPDGDILLKEIGFDSSGQGKIEKKLQEVLGRDTQ